MTMKDDKSFYVETFVMKMQEKRRYRKLWCQLLQTVTFIASFPKVVTIQNIGNLDHNT